jgi:hypothetical protein
MSFFVLRVPKAGEAPAVTYFLPAAGSRTGDAPRCSVCGNFVGMLPLLPRIRVELETWERMFGDIVFGPGDELLLTERVVKLFRSSALIGLLEVDKAEVIKVKSRRKLSTNVPTYFCCTVARSRAALDDVKSGVVREEPWTCEECRIGSVKRATGVYLEPESWSGEDIFIARGLPGTILTSDRFKTLCEEHSISNCELVPADRFHFDHYPWEMRS